MAKTTLPKSKSAQPPKSKPQPRQLDVPSLAEWLEKTGRHLQDLSDLLYENQHGDNLTLGVEALIHHHAQDILQFAAALRGEREQKESES